MAEKETMVSITATQLQDILTAALKAANQPNALEAKHIAEEAERERRQQALAVELARVEEEARWRKQNSCSHSVNEKTGEPVAKGTGKWATGGQMHGDDSCTLICQRCAQVFRFMPTREEREYIINGQGLLGFAPPPLERLINREDFMQ